jgi:hypothetical protein
MEEKMITQSKHINIYDNLIAPIFFSVFRRSSIRSFWTLSLIFCALVFGQQNVLAGVDDLRGQWQFTVEGLPEYPNLIVFVNDLGPATNGENENVYVATGCMEMPATGVLTPMSMQATDKGNEIYDLNILSTVYPNPFVIQFLGSASVNESSVVDDKAAGSFRTEKKQGTWSAVHHDRRRTECPPVDEIPPPGLTFNADVLVGQLLRNGVVETESTILDATTNIVSTRMLVEQPDGTKITVPPFTDVFSPNVDFITQFRYLKLEVGVTPPSGGVHTFTLLDALSNPIAGTTKTDVWTACLADPPKDVSWEVKSNLDIDLSWSPVSSVPGFDPPNGQGYYQIELSGGSYGANVIRSPTHIVPWDDFGGTIAAGTPDGFDYGKALSQLDNDIYLLAVISFSLPAPGTAGQRIECQSREIQEFLTVNKQEASITITKP